MSALPSPLDFEKAYRDLENKLCDMRDLAAVLDVVAEETVYSRDTALEEFVRAKSGMAGYHVCVMTEGQSQALRYVLHQLTLVGRDVAKSYYDSWPRPASAEGDR